MRMMDLFDLYNNTCADVNTQQGGVLRPYGTFNKWLINISTNLFNKYFANWEKSQGIDDVLAAAFLKTLNVVPQKVPGKNYDFVPFPADYGYFSSMRFLHYENEEKGCLCADYDVFDGKDTVKFEDSSLAELKTKFKTGYEAEQAAAKVDNSRFAAALSHKLMPVDFSNPILTSQAGGLKIAPKNMGIVVMDYFRLPAIPVFAYTSGGGPDTINYNRSGSTQLDWPDLVQNEFLSELKKRYASYTTQENKYAEAVSEGQMAKVE